VGAGLNKYVIYATADEADAYMFYRCFFLFFLFFLRSTQNTRQPFSGTAERIFMKLLPNDSSENGVSNVVPKWGLGPQIILWGLQTEIVRTGVVASRTTEN